MKARVVQTVKATNERLHEIRQIVFSKENKHLPFFAIIDPLSRFQKHIGFGGAITEAATYTLKAGMSAKQRAEVLSSYYSKQGLNYNLARIHMNSCDFSLGNYSYVKEGDSGLKTFDIKRETIYVIPFILDAMKFQPSLKILASPWSPPAWMKNNNDMNHGGYLLPKFYQSWANYYVRFIEEMGKHGVPIWAVTVQNEPAAVQTWDSCVYTPEQERDFVKNFLGPTMETNGLGDKKILVWDHNRDIILDRVKPIYDDKDCSRYVWGTAFHWYVNESLGNTRKLHELYPDKHLLFTEGCVEGGPQPDNWEAGEKYARNIISDLNNGLEGFIDWNITLDEQGGPNHVGNYCNSAIISDTINKKLLYGVSYYYIGHFSKYILPGATRIGIKSQLPDGVRNVAYDNDNGQIVVVLYNESNSSIKMSLEIDDERAACDLAAHSIVTYIIDRNEMKKL